MDNNIFGRTSRMKITYMLHENVIYIYKSWFFYFPRPTQNVYTYIGKDIRSNGVFGFRYAMEKRSKKKP